MTLSSLPDAPGRPRARAAWARYGVAFASVAAAILVKLAAGHWLSEDAAVVFLAAAALASWYGGALPGATAVLLAALAQAYFFIEPHGSIRVASAQSAVELACWVVEGLVLCGLWRAMDAQRRARISAEAQLRLFETTPVPMYVLDSPTGRVVAANSAAAALYGYAREELLTLTLAGLDQAGAAADAPRTTTWTGARRHRAKDGRVLDVDVVACAPSPTTISVVARDMTEKRSLERQLAHSQKMEAVGTLAGGVAHDFNNLLSVILSYAEVAADDLAPDHPVRADLAEIRRAGQRATALTRQLLAFARREVREPKVLDLDEVVAGMHGMLKRLLGGPIELTTLAGATTAPVEADPGELEQVVMNLAVNARDAMPNGGRLDIRTAAVTVDASTAHAGGAPAGRYVRLSVTDTGLGMDTATQQRIFEPFFTTKEKGKGTGLGLAVVFGIVQRSGGRVWVESTVGRGTTFHVLLPCHASSSPATTAEAPQAAAAARADGDEGSAAATILLVEDDDQVRTVAATILRARGHTVLEAQNGGEAFLICERHERPIDLLLTDIVMPRLSGGEVARRLGPMRPGMAVLYMSGHPDDVVLDYAGAGGEIALLSKPITPDSLTRKVRDVLARLPAREAVVGARPRGASPVRPAIVNA